MTVLPQIENHTERASGYFPGARSSFHIGYRIPDWPSEIFFVLLPVKSAVTIFVSMKFDKNKILDFIRHRLSIGKLFLAVFVIFIIFIDENSCIQRIKYDNEINRLRQEIAAQNDTTDYYNRRIEELKSNKSVVEQIAREQYLMSKPNEDIYIIERPSVEND